MCVMLQRYAYVWLGHVCVCDVAEVCVCLVGTCVCDVAEVCVCLVAECFHHGYEVMFQSASSLRYVYTKIMVFQSACSRDIHLR